MSTTYTNHYLDQPLRAEDDAKRQVYLARLEGMLNARRSQALEARNGSGLAVAEKIAGLCERDIAALEWALRELGEGE